jgi:hypothetical protein
LNIYLSLEASISDLSAYTGHKAVNLKPVEDAFKGLTLREGDVVLLAGGHDVAVLNEQQPLGGH